MQWQRLQATIHTAILSAPVFKDKHLCAIGSLGSCFDVVFLDSSLAVVPAQDVLLLPLHLCLATVEKITVSVSLTRSGSRGTRKNHGVKKINGQGPHLRGKPLLSGDRLGTRHKLLIHSSLLFRQFSQFFRLFHVVHHLPKIRGLRRGTSVLLRFLSRSSRMPCILTSLLFLVWHYRAKS